MSNSISEILSVEQFNNELRCTNKYIFVDFYATWCGPCKKIVPELKKLCDEYEEIKFLKVDVGKIPVLAKQYQISAMPTFLLFHVIDSDTIPFYKKIVGADINKITNLLKSTRVVITEHDLF